jgi:hypothetical protein
MWTLSAIDLLLSVPLCRTGSTQLFCQACSRRLRSSASGKYQPSEIKSQFVGSRQASAPYISPCTVTERRMQCSSHRIYEEFLATDRPRQMLAIEFGAW